MPRDWNPDEPEWMDRPQPVSAVLERDLEQIGSLNRRFGGHGIVRHFLGHWWQRGGRYRVLDLCTGYGDIPRMLVPWAGARGIALEVDAVDAHPATLEIARRQSAACPQIRFHEADALSFEPQGRYDLVLCTLSLHHFSDEDAVRLLRRVREWAPGHVLICDLERRRLTRWAVWLVTATLYRDEMIRHDARLSAGRAFSGAELQALAGQAGWSGGGYRRFFPCRQALWL